MCIDKRMFYAKDLLDIEEVFCENGYVIFKEPAEEFSIETHCFDICYTNASRCNSNL